MDKIKEVIIVEGKTDTQKLKNIFGEEIKTIETQGLSLNNKTIELIKKINQEQGIIIFTDPDGPGKKIREKIINELNNEAKNAFITKNDIDKNSKKIGIAEADENAIKKALENVVTFDNGKESLTWSEYLNNDFYLKENRIKICDYFGFDKNVSSKSLFKWLNWMNLKSENVKEILEGK